MFKVIILQDMSTDGLFLHIVYRPNTVIRYCN